MPKSLLIGLAWVAAVVATIIFVLLLPPGPWRKPAALTLAVIGGVLLKGLPWWRYQRAVEAEQRRLRTGPPRPEPIDHELVDEDRRRHRRGALFIGIGILGYALIVTSSWLTHGSSPVLWFASPFLITMGLLMFCSREVFRVLTFVQPRMPRV